MARPKIARKSTTVDMTAMCDVAFLLLAFFILTTKFKPSEAVPINTPNSVAAKIAPETNVVMISLNKDGKVFLSTGDSKGDKDKKQAILQSVNKTRNLGLTDAEIAALVKAPFIGVSLAQLKQQARMQTDQMTGETLPGIPAKDSTNNEMIDWMRGVADAYQGMKPNLLLKGDNVAKYPSFRNIIDAFRKNDFFKFQMVTNPESVPTGSDLYKLSVSGKREE
jgi:biopolymer transport protein ExbD